MFCTLPQDPAINPENVSIQIECDSVKIGVNKDVTINLSLFLEDLVDSVRITFGDLSPDGTFIIHSGDTSLVILHKFTEAESFRIFATASAQGVERTDDFTLIVVDPVVVQFNNEVQTTANPEA